MRPRFLVLALLSVIMASIPASASALEANREHSISNSSLQVFRRGESLFSIGGRHSVSVDSITTANSLVGVQEVQVGTRLVIPTNQNSSTADTATVSFGETLYQIALRYGVSVERLGLINHVVNPALIFSGQQLDVPSADGVDGTAPLSLLRIGSEQSFWQSVFARNEIPAQIILENELANPFLILPGQIIRMPQGSGDEAILGDPWHSLELHPLTIEPGRTGSLIIQTTQPGTITGTFLGNDLRLIPDGENRYVALLGIYRWTAPGIYPLMIVYSDETGKEAIYTRDAQIVPGGYAQETIWLSEEDAAVLADAETVQGEAGYVQQVMSGFTTERYWQGLFRLPAAGIMSSAFGTARSYDGRNSYGTFHAGADLAAPTGTPIYAPAAGVVADTASLSVRGYATIVDHGWGVYSGFWHQSSILVQPGDIVAQGQQIGTVGNTGLSTAAHVHWEMWVTGVQVDPLQWAREQFP